MEEIMDRASWIIIAIMFGCAVGITVGIKLTSNAIRKHAAKLDLRIQDREGKTLSIDNVLLDAQGKFAAKFAADKRAQRHLITTFAILTVLNLVICLILLVLR